MAVPYPYNGPRRKLVLAFDVGTTFSGISYSILDPGLVPETKGVTKYPGQEEFHGSSKVPSVIYYDQQGGIRAIGAETTSPGVESLAEDFNWIKTEWFKLHLRPRSTIEDNLIIQKIPPLRLPQNKTAVDVLADYYKYLLRCSRAYIEETHPNGADLWNSLETDIDFVLSHPNGWEGIQQSHMRKAAVLAGLIPSGRVGESRLSFVTEGEASLHFAIQYGLPSKAKTVEDGVIIVDAGGGTIDISAYSRMAQTSSNTFAEISAPKSYLVGSIFVGGYARTFLQSYLEESDFVDDVDHIVRRFDETTKMRFRNSEEPQYVKFGSTKDNDPTYNIRHGQIKLLGSDVASFFKPSIDCVVEAVGEQRRTAHKRINYVVFVGGFAASDWLYQRVASALRPGGYYVHRPNYYVNKAVADGAISHYLNHYVRERVSKITYGILGSIRFNPDDPEHRKREAKTYFMASGARCLRAFLVLLATNTKIRENDKIRKEFVYEDQSLANDGRAQLYCYRGQVSGSSVWMDEDIDLFSELGSISADFSTLWYNRRAYLRQGSKGFYYEIPHSIIMFFGGVEIKVQISWTDNGVERRSDAKILYAESMKKLAHKPSIQIQNLGTISFRS